MKNANIHLGLVFTRSVTLAEWKRQGLYEREILLYKELGARGVRVSFFTYDVEPIQAEPDITVYHKPYRWMPNIVYSILMPVIQWREFRSCSLLKSNQVDGSWAVILGSRLYRIPALIRGGYEWYLTSVRIGRGRLYRGVVYAIEAMVYRLAHRIVLTSPADAAATIDTFHIPSGKLLSIPNFIDIDLFAPSRAYAEEVHQVLYIGRLNPEKNIDSLVQAMDGLPLHLTVVGDGVLRTKLAALTARLDVQITFTGNIPNNEIPKMLQSADVYVQPSHFEGYPKTVLEAMSCGVPTIVSDVTGNRDIVTDGETGMYCDTTPESIREQLLALSKASVDERTRLGSNARKWVESNVSLTDVVRQELEVYSSLLDL